jgi:hypothetical protein
MGVTFLDLLGVILGVLAGVDDGFLSAGVDGGLSSWLLAVFLVGEGVFLCGIILLLLGLPS